MKTNGNQETELIEVSIAFKVKGWSGENEASPVEGWEIGELYKYCGIKRFTFDNLQDAYAKAQSLRMEYWNITRIGDNEIAEYSISMNRNKELQSFYYTYFSPREKQDN